MNFPMYHLNLNSYKYPPRNNTTLADIKTICLERIVLYKIMVEAEYLNFIPGSQEWKDYLTTEIIDKNLITYNLLLNKNVVVGSFKARRRDHIAHWILSLCKLS